jgi:hypothetical protein
VSDLKPLTCLQPDWTPGTPVDAVLPVALPEFSEIMQGWELDPTNVIYKPGLLHVWVHRKARILVSVDDGRLCFTCWSTRDEGVLQVLGIMLAAMFIGNERPDWRWIEGNLVGSLETGQVRAYHLADPASVLT